MLDQEWDLDKYGLEMRAPRGGGCVSSGFLPTLRASRLLWLLRTDELMAVGLWLQALGVVLTRGSRYWKVAFQLCFWGESDIVIKQTLRFY